MSRKKAIRNIHDPGDAPTDPSGELDRGHLARIRSCEDTLSKCENKLACIKEHMALAKANLRDAARELRECIADGTGRLLFEESSQAAGGESWRSVTLEELKIPAGLSKKLTEAGFETLGKLADHTAAGKRFADIKGIGQAAAEKIEKACERWWEKNPLAKAAVN